MTETDIQHLQEFAYARGYDYRAGAPHLKHSGLYDWLTSSLRDEVRHVVRAGLPANVLEIGAGDGAFVEPLLAAERRCEQLRCLGLRLRLCALDLD